MKGSWRFWIAAVPLFLLAQIPAFVSWTTNLGPWDHGLSDYPLIGQLIGIAFVAGVGAVLFAVFVGITLGALALQRRGASGAALSKMKQGLTIAVGLTIGFAGAAAAEWLIVSVMKAG